jgi:hypothetical protein
MNHQVADHVHICTPLDEGRHPVALDEAWSGKNAGERPQGGIKPL